MGTKAVSGNNQKMGRVFLNGQEFCVEDWDISEVCDEEDTTSTCDAGYATQEFTTCRLEGTLNLTYDVTANPFDSPHLLCVGKKHENTKLYLHASPGVGNEDGPFWSFTLQVASGLQTSVPVKGKVAITVPFISVGAYAKPTGSDSSGA